MNQNHEILLTSRTYMVLENIIVGEMKTDKWTRNRTTLLENRRQVFRGGEEDGKGWDGEGWDSEEYIRSKHNMYM